jgi:hypothetical protein
MSLIAAVAVQLRPFKPTISCLRFAISSPMQTNIDNNAEPGLQRDPDEWKTGDEP